MVKIKKNNKMPEKNFSKKVVNGIKKEDKQKLSIKTKKNTDGELKKKLMKKAKGSKELKTNIQNMVQPKVKEIEKEIPKEINQTKSIKARNTLKVTKKIAKNKPSKQIEKVEIYNSSIKPKLEAKCFDEEQFESIVNLENIKEVCKALKKLVEAEVKEKKASIFSDYRYFLNVASYKIPNCPRRMVKLDLKHSLVAPKEDDIVLFVPDLQRGARVDYEPTIMHYEDLLQDCGVKGLKIIPFNQLRNEYTTFEAKRKLANTYDYFLCDGRIAGHVVGFGGKVFQKPRTTIHSVHLNDPHKYKAHIEKALKRTSFKQLHKGDIISIPVGSYRFTINQLGENIKFVIDQLKRVFPGGYANVRNMYIKIDIKGTSALPLYVSIAGPPPDTPNVVGPREKRLIKLKKQANDVLSKFSLSKTGDFIRLNKSQVARKQHIREARSVLLSRENDANEIEIPLTKKNKNKNAASFEQNKINEDDNFEDPADVESEIDDNEDDSENSDEEE